MSDLVHVRHPIVHRYVPARGRTPRIGVAEGTTACRLRHVEDIPIEVAKMGYERIYASEGSAWMALTLYGDAATPRQLIRLLSEGAARTRAIGGFVEGYHREVERSPLHYRDDVSELQPEPYKMAMGDKVVEDGNERASKAVQNYVDETFRISGDRVLVRFRHLVMASEIHRAAPLLQTRSYPRLDGLKSQMGLRHDRVNELVALKGGRARISNPEARDWFHLRTIPGELLDDFDIEYAANALPTRIRQQLASWSKGEAATERKQRLQAAMPLLQRLVEDSWTHAVTGDRVEPALAFLGGVLNDLVAEQEVMDRCSPTQTPRPPHVATRLMGEMVGRVYLPRWRTGSGIVPEDDAALGQLAI